MALDYRIDEDSAANSVIAQCFQTNGMNGFRFWVNNGSKVAWGTESTTGAHLGSRDMIVLRHTKGENGIHVYAANTTAAEIGYIQLNRTRTTQTNATLVFGCAKADDGAYERYAKVQSTGASSGIPTWVMLPAGSWPHGHMRTSPSRLVALNGIT